MTWIECRNIRFLEGNRVVKFERNRSFQNFSENVENFKKRSKHSRNVSEFQKILRI